MLGRSGLDAEKASENYPVPTVADGLEGVKVWRVSRVSRFASNLIALKDAYSFSRS